MDPWQKKEVRLNAGAADDAPAVRFTAQLPGTRTTASNRTSVLASGMAETAWEKGFLMPELPAKQPWERCLYCSSFDLWQGTLAVCCNRCLHATVSANGCPGVADNGHPGLRRSARSGFFA